MNDILHEARERILIENQAILPTTPKDLKETYEKPAAWAGFFAGAVAGGTIGAHIGLALGPLGAMAGTIPCAIIGGIMGAFGAAKAGARFEQAAVVVSHTGNMHRTTGQTIHASMFKGLLSGSRKAYCPSCGAEQVVSKASEFAASINSCPKCNPKFWPMYYRKYPNE